MRRFNVTGNCVPSEDYMVDISDKINKIRKLIDNRDYFTINRARQYGKTTTLAALENAIADEYTVISTSFQGIGDSSFETEGAFCRTFLERTARIIRFSGDEVFANKWINPNVKTFDDLSVHITEMCRDKKIVLMIDEVDQASNHRVFLNFLGTLREKYLARKNGKDYTFHSVILAGVYDIKTIKLKMMSEGTHTPSATENKIYNSPWNIAVNFTVDMSFSPAEISTMLNEYETDRNTGMDIAAISQEIYDYTSGYPFLVSRICQCIDEELDKNWTGDGVKKAVDILLSEDNTLFQDLFKNIYNNKNLRELLYDILFVGKQMPFSIDDETISMGYMYGFLKNSDGKTRVSNRIFEMRIYNYFVLQEIKAADYSLNSVKATVVRNGRFDMSLCLDRFRRHYAEITAGRDVNFLERHGTLLFLSYLKPLINGEGDYYVEPQLGDMRMDIAVQYRSEQFIIEMKIWHGEKNHESAYRQLYEYLNRKNIDSGYLLTFDFREERSKESKAEWVEYGGKKIFDVIV